ncbi:ABC transporter ATP-binding protein [Actinomycetaceae bacterium L2_0104]
MIELQRVSVSVDDLSSTERGATKTLLTSVDAILPEPRIAIIGANGSGKSTLLKLLNGLIQPSGGRVIVDGLDTVADGKKLRRHVGYIFTDPLAQLVMSTPLDDIQLSLRPFVKNRQERRARAMELLRGRGLGDLAERSIYDLSGGERQLVSLTTVLAVEPGVVVADEPTTLLDLRNRHRLHEALTSLDQQLIVSTHDLDLAAQMDRVLWVDDGMIVADGSPTAVIPAYTEAMGA